MQKKITAMMLIILMLISASGCGSMKKKRYEAQFLTFFDTITQIVGYSENEKEFTKYSQMIFDELKIYHELYDIYNDYEGINNIKTINDAAGKEAVKVDEKIIDLFLFSKEMYTKTNGKMDIALGSVLSIWHDYRTKGIDSPDEAILPPINLLEDSAKHTDIQKIIIDEINHTVFLQDPKMSIDVGAVAKGYAVEKVCQTVEAQGFYNGLVSVGGNVRAIGSKDEGGTPWNIGVQNPDSSSENSILYNMDLVDAALVTSGNYERYYTVDGKNYHHIIDPDTLMPTTYYSSVVIISPDSALADCLSTALFNLPYKEGKLLVEEFPGTEALWIGLDFSMLYSDKFKDFIKK